MIPASPLSDQLAAERRARADAINEAQRQQVDPNRWRTEAELQRLAEADAARIAAEDALNAAHREKLAADRAFDQLSQKDGESLFWRGVSDSMVTPNARAFAARGRAAIEAVEQAHEKLQEATRAYRKVEREVNAAGAARRQRAKLEGRL